MGDNRVGSQRKAIPVSLDHVPSEQEEIFIHARVELGMNPKQAWLHAGYADHNNSDAYKKDKRLSPLIQKRVQQRLVSGAPKALSIIEEIMQDGSVASNTRLKAATEWLDRSGFSKTVEMRITEGEKSIDELSQEEIEARLKKKAKSLYLLKQFKDPEIEVTNAIDAEVVDG